MNKDNLLTAVSVLIGFLMFFGFIGTVVYMDHANNRNNLQICVNAGGSWNDGTCILDKSK